MMNKFKLKKTIIVVILMLVINNALLATTYNAEVYYPVLNAKSNLLMDADSGIIYIADNIDEIMGIASLTKLMSVYVLFDEITEQNIKKDDIVTISEKAQMIKANAPGISGQYYVAGQKMTVEDLIYESLVYSDNSAIIALSEYVSNSEENHVKKMNEKAKQLGMDSTSFYNVSGLTMSDYGDYKVNGTNNKDYNKSTSRDMGLLCYNLLKDYPEILNITSVTQIDYQGYTYNNWNQLLPGMPYEYEGVKGLKTGTSNEAGECLIGYLETEKRNYVSVVLGAPSSEKSTTNRYLETITIYEWAKEQRYSTLLSKEKPEKLIKIKGASEKVIELYPRNIDILTSDNVYLKLNSIEYNTEYFDENNYLIKDIPQGEVVATLVYDTPENSVNLQTVFNKNNNLKVEYTAKDVIKQKNSILKIGSAFNMFLKEIYANI